MDHGGGYKMRKYYLIYILFYELCSYAQPANQIEYRVNVFCTNDMSNIVQDTQHCIQNINEFLKDITQRREDSVSPLNWIRGIDPPPTYIWDNEIKDKSIDFCTNDSSTNIVGSTDQCIQKVRSFLNLTMRMTEKHNGYTTSISDVTRDFSFMDSSTWNPGFVGFNLPRLYTYIENTEYCIQDIHTLLNEITLVVNQTKTAQIKSVCESLDTFNDYVNCLNVKKDLILAIESLIDSAQNSLCSSPAYLDHVVKDLQSILQTLQTEYITLSKARYLIFEHQRALQQEQINQEVIDESGPAFCEMDIHNIYQDILLEFTINNYPKIGGSVLRPIEQGDLYKLNQSITKYRILTDKLLSLSEVCSLQHLPLIEDVHQMMTQFENNFKDNNSIFDQTSKYTCEKLNQSNEEAVLCENPINNSSWIYSSHHFLEQLLGD